jgi:hypothetical protein
MSAPAMNALLPAPVRMAPAPPVISRVLEGRSNVVHVGVFKALSTLGRLTVT